MMNVFFGQETEINSLNHRHRRWLSPRITIWWSCLRERITTFRTWMNSPWLLPPPPMSKIPTTTGWGRSTVRQKDSPAFCSVIQLIGVSPPLKTTRRRPEPSQSTRVSIATMRTTRTTGIAFSTWLILHPPIHQPCSDLMVHIDCYVDSFPILFFLFLFLLKLKLHENDLLFLHSSVRSGICFA